MKISEVIKELQKIQQEYGDLEEVSIVQDDRVLAFEEFDLTIDETTLYIG